MDGEKIINGITTYRIVAAPVLIVLALTHQLEWFKWLLPVSFFTDAIDGYLARHFKKTSILGAKLDSIGDDLTVLAATVGMFAFHLSFILQHKVLIFGMFGLYIFQVVQSFICYGKLSGFHTYLAKLAAVLQGVFLILSFFTIEPWLSLFYAATIFTIFDLAEEIILGFMLSKWEANVKGIYWVMKR